MTQSIEALIEQNFLRWHVQRESIKNVYHKRHTPSPVITLSRLLGSNASHIADAVAEQMKCKLLGIKIMDEVARQSDTRKELVDAMDERVTHQLKEWIEKTFSSRPALDSDVHHRHLIKAINFFMEEGNVILLGRGAGFMPRTRPRLDVRIVAPMKNRIKRVMHLKQCSSAEAARIINDSDLHRAQFIRQVFGEDWWDSRHYDMVINTATIKTEGAVFMIKSAWDDIAKTALEANTGMPAIAHS